jgi:hypothetical protein
MDPHERLGSISETLTAYCERFSGCPSNGDSRQHMLLLYAPIVPGNDLDLSIAPTLEVPVKRAIFRKLLTRTTSASPHTIRPAFRSPHVASFTTRIPFSYDSASLLISEIKRARFSTISVPFVHFLRLLSP